MLDTSRFDTPIICPAMTVRPEWIDYNDHLNMAYYNVLFDQSADAAVEILNLGEAYRRGENKTLMTAETHVTYVKELKVNSEVQATFRLLDADAKSLHTYMELYHSDGWLAATSESMLLHVDLRPGESGPKVVRFAQSIQDDIDTMLRYHRSLPRPKYVGKVMGVRRR